MKKDREQRKGGDGLGNNHDGHEEEMLKFEKK